MHRCPTRHLVKLLAVATILSGFTSPAVAAAGDNDEQIKTRTRILLRERPGLETLYTPELLFGPYTVIGVELINVTPELRRHFGADGEAGVLVSRVAEDSPAERAGIEVGDLLTSVDGKPVVIVSEVGRIIRSHEENDTVEIEIWRDGRLRQLSSGVEVHEVDARFPAVLRKLETQPLMRLMKPREGQEGWELKVDPDAWPAVSGSLRELKKSLADPAFKYRFEGMRRDREDLAQKIELLEQRLRDMEERLEALDDR